MVSGRLTETVASAVASQIGMVGTLQNAGARYILVPTIPDLGITPAFRAQGATVQATGTALTINYNTALFGGLATNNLRVIPIDTFTLIREITANPGAYGLSAADLAPIQDALTKWSAAYPAHLDAQQAALAASEIKAKGREIAEKAARSLAKPEADRVVAQHCLEVSP